MTSFIIEYLFDSFFLTNSNNACPNITDSSSIFTPYTLSDLYVAAYGNPNPSNITGYWLRVQFCVSQIGSSTAPTCSNTSVPNISSVQCYTRQDIQITYANVGSVTNPQPILGAVVFYYQGLVSDLFLECMHIFFPIFRLQHRQHQYSLHRRLLFKMYQIHLRLEGIKYHDLILEYRVIFSIHSLLIVLHLQLHSH